jgi:hypothetical protein
MASVAHLEDEGMKGYVLGGMDEPADKTNTGMSPILRFLLRCLTLWLQP